MDEEPFDEGWALVGLDAPIEVSVDRSMSASAYGHGVLSGGGGVAFLLLTIESASEICVLCDEDPQGGLFTHAWYLVTSCLGSSGGKALYEDVDDPGVLCQLSGLGQPLSDLFVVKITYDGKSAIGAGRNWKRRERAAKLALAASIYSRADATAIPDPTHDGAFPLLVHRVRRELELYAMRMTLDTLD